MTRTYTYKKRLSALAAVFAITVGVFATGASASAAPAPSSLTVATGTEEIYSYTDIASANTITIERGGKLFICTGVNGYATVNAAITFSNTGTGASPSVTVEACMGADGEAPFTTGATLNGAITLETDGVINASWGSIKVNGALTANGHKLTTIAANGARVMGTGQMGVLQIGSNSSIMPGNSPGIISSLDLTLDAGSTYGFEVGGTAPGTGYDQIDVTGAVSIAGNLDVSLYGGFVPTAGQTYVIINNDAADAVSGTFAGLAQGAQFAADGQLFTISYTGGDGNDVVLTAQGAEPAAPGAPNTGFALQLANPVVVAALGILSASLLLVIAYRIRKTN